MVEASGRRQTRQAVAFVALLGVVAALLAGPGASAAASGTADQAPQPTEPAQHFTDFSDGVVGQPPVGWTSRWRDSDWVVLADPWRLRHTVDASAGRRALTWDAPGDRDEEPGVVVGDVEVYTLVRGESRAPFQLPVYLSGEAGTENSVYVDLQGDEQNLRIQRYLDGTPSTLARTSFEVVEGRWYHVVLRSEGDRFMAKAWPDGADEPDDWLVEATDSSFDQGRVGFSNFLAGSVGEFAAYGVGTGGEPAPRSAD